MNLRLTYTLSRIFALTLLVGLSPLILGITLLLFFYNRGHVLFSQDRLGLHQRSFVIFKFRTFGTDGRVTRLGSFLRRLSLDELPQLINVILGEMCLVGPRPLPVEYLVLHRRTELRRYDVKPGMTGLVQVSGGNRLSWDKRFELDLQYVEMASAATDLKIIFRTIPLLFSGKKSESILLTRQT